MFVCVVLSCLFIVVCWVSAMGRCVCWLFVLDIVSSQCSFVSACCLVGFVFRCVVLVPSFWSSFVGVWFVCGWMSIVNVVMLVVGS